MREQQVQAPSHHVAAAEDQQGAHDDEREEDRPVDQAVGEAHCVLDAAQSLTPSGVTFSTGTAYV